MKKFFLLLSACVSVLAQSCIDANDCTVNTEIETQVLIINSGFTAISSSDLVDETYQVFVYKAGYNNETVTVGIEEDESILADYNAQNGTSYAAMPSSLYTIGNGVSLNTAHYSDSIAVTFDTSAIESASAENNYVLPLVLGGLPSEKISENNYILIHYNN